MKLAAITLLSVLAGHVAASPVPAVEWVTITELTTVTVSYPDTSEVSVATEAADTIVVTIVETVTLGDAETKVTTTSTGPGSTTTATAGSPSSAVTTTATPATTSTPATTAFSTIEASTISIAATSATTATSSTASLTSGFSGQGTYYSTGLGACGITNVDTDYICAISHELYDEYTPDGNPNDNTLCGKKITAHYGGKSVEVTVVDRCEGCSYYDLDFSPSAFDLIADASLGRIDITWEWA